MSCTFANRNLLSLKARLDSIIKENVSDPKKYWISLLQYLEGDLSQLELFEVVKECLGAENVSEHNKLITSLLFKYRPSQQKENSAIYEDIGNSNFTPSKGTWLTSLIVDSYPLEEESKTIELPQNYLLEALEPDYAIKSLDALYADRKIDQSITASDTKKSAFTQLPGFADVCDCFLDTASLHGINPNLISDQVLVDTMHALQNFSYSCILKAVQIMAPACSEPKYSFGYSINKVKNIRRENYQKPSDDIKKKLLSSNRRSFNVCSSAISIASRKILTNQKEIFSD